MINTYVFSEFVNQMTFQASEASKSEFELIERSLEYDILWSDHNSDNCVSTGWRVLPFWVVLTVRAGSYSCTFQEDNQRATASSPAAEKKKQVIITANEVLLIPAGVRHKLEVSQPTIADSLHVQYSFFHNLDVFSFYHIPNVIKADRAKSLFDAVAQLTQIMDHVVASASLSNVTAKVASAYILFKEIISVSTPVLEKHQKFLLVHRIQPALALLDAKIHTPLKVEAMAVACNISRNAFTRLFKEATGQTPQLYLTLQRIDTAMSKLVYSNLTIAQVAEQVGFCDQFHFSKVFRSYRGETPSQYRLNTRKSLQHLT